MEEKILGDEEAELFGLKQKVLPKDQPMPEEGVAQEVEIPFDFTEIEEDDESLVMLSPEEAAKLLKKREEKARKDKARCEKLKKDGEAAIEQGDFEKARECFTQANEFEPDDLEINVGYMRAYSEDFTALDDFETLQEVYEQCYESAGDAFALCIKERFGERLQAALEESEREEEQLNAAFTAAQDERREHFSARAHKQNGLLFKLGGPFFLCLVVVVISLCFINAIKGNLFIILSIVFGVLSAVLVIPTVIAAKKAYDANRLLRENEDIYSTQEGRELARLRDKINFISTCLD